jgi:hypothetical protein
VIPPTASFMRPWRKTLSKRTRIDEGWSAHIKPQFVLPQNLIKGKEGENG